MMVEERHVNRILDLTFSIHKGQKFLEESELFMELEPRHRVVGYRLMEPRAMAECIRILFRCYCHPIDSRQPHLDWKGELAKEDR